MQTLKTESKKIKVGQIYEHDDSLNYRVIKIKINYSDKIHSSGIILSSNKKNDSTIGTKYFLDTDFLINPKYFTLLNDFDKDCLCCWYCNTFYDNLYAISNKYEFICWKCKINCFMKK